MAVAGLLCPATDAAAAADDDEDEDVDDDGIMADISDVDPASFCCCNLNSGCCCGDMSCESIFNGEHSGCC